jgi:hypothetical protein
MATELDHLPSPPESASEAEPRGASRRLLPATAIVCSITASTSVSAWLIGIGARSVWGSRDAPWILGRAAGVTAYVLLVLLVLAGLVLSHPWRTRISRPSAGTRIRAHVALAVFTLAFMALHVVALATDSYAGVGLRGALLPMGASYRPVAVTMGVIGMEAGLLAGVTAALAGHVTARIWWPIHKVAASSLVLVWIHGILAGSDSRTLLGLYIGTGALVIVVGLSRYAARTPADRVEQLTAERDGAA